MLSKVCVANETMTESKATKEFDIRSYQQAIIGVCIAKNSIVYLPTGAGKSYIAIQVIKHFSKDLEKKYSEGGKRSVFLVNTVCLAKQQAEAIADMVPYKVSVLCSEQNVDFWKEPEWNSVLEEHEILVATAQVILDAIKRAYIKVQQINVIVFDECHHGRKDHAYHEIMKQFNTDGSSSVRVIGLSGMLIGNDNKIKPYTVSDELIKLESTFLSTVITVNNLDDHKNVLLCSTNAIESFVRFRSQIAHPIIESISSDLEKIMEKLEAVKFENYVTIHAKSLKPTTPKKIKELILMFKDFYYLAGEMGAFGGYLSLLSTLIQFELIKRWSETEKYREIVKSCITLTERSINKMTLELGFSRHDLESVSMHLSDKVRKLILLLRKFFTDPNREKDLQCIVFVERRSTAKAIYHVLKTVAKCDKTFPIVPDFMVGINNEVPESIEAIVSSNFNSLTLEKFTKKETNLIVSSSVLEEGIDLQMCNLVVMYDKPKTYRSYVQARGRARVNNSNYVVFVEDSKQREFQNKVIVWRNVDAVLKDELLMKTLDREPPSEESIQLERTEVWEPFITPISKSVLNNLNSINVLNLYSSMMPADRFTNINVYWRRIDHEDKMISAAIQLPSQSSIKEEVISDPQINVRLAKQQAAFKACIQLYEHGELNDNLVPVDGKQKIELHDDEYFTHWESFAGDKKTAGTRNHRRYHQMKTPAVLENCAPKVGATSFLYHIKVQPKFDATNKAMKEFHKLLGNGNDFGILLSKRFPRLCQMTLFQTFGEIEVKISGVPVPIVLKNEVELNELQNFHVAIFRDVLNTWQKYFVLDDTSYLIVPLTDNVDIDWKLVTEFQSVEQPRRLTYDEITVTEFSRRAYLHRVVNPVYRSTDPKYVVIDVPEHMTPMSPFPSEKYESYKQYMELNFSLNICKPNQPMIEVKGISKNLNLFFPGTGTGGKQRKHEKENLTEHYIPELVHNFKFPADYWLKATLLPSICHRLKFMLLAEELRVWLVDEKIDENNGRHVHELDVDYGNYDEREKKLEEDENQRLSYGQFPNLDELCRQLEHDCPTSSTNDTRHTKALLLWDKSKLPIDINRNWLTVTEAELDYYCSFLTSNKNQIVPASLCRLQQLNGSPKRVDRSLMDSTDRKHIQILTMNPKIGSVQQKHLIKVLTTSNAGDVFDMERYEVLGDGFLKFISSLYLYKKYEDWHEGYLTSLKGKIVSNRNLFYLGSNFGLNQMIKSSKFNTDESLPPSIRLPKNVQPILEDDMTLLIKLTNIDDLSNEEVISGQMKAPALQTFVRKPDFEHYEEDSDDQVEKSFLPYINKHHVGDKIIADAVEAFLGVVVQSIGIHAGLKLCQKLNILPEEDDICRLLTEPIPPRIVLQNTSLRDARVNNRQDLEGIIGYSFQEPMYLVQALTHASYPIKVMGSYQQLEFLGDAVLDFLVTSYITEQNPKMDPGKLTDLRSALVNNVTLACVVVRNGIHKFLLSENVLLSEAIKKFVGYQNTKDNRVVLDQIIMLETEDDASTAEAVDVPKVIGDIFESIIGAVFLDSGLNLVVTWNVIYGLLHEELQDFMNNVPLQIVRQLFEYEKGSAEPRFYDSQPVDEESVAIPLEIFCGIDKDGVKVKRTFVGIGKNRTLAKKCAAKLALKALKALIDN